MLKFLRPIIRGIFLPFVHKAIFELVGDFVMCTHCALLNSLIDERALSKYEDTELPQSARER